MSKNRIIGGRYRLEERLGRGNFGVVWRADELLAGQPVATVAVKMFTTEVDRREISLLAGVSHPSVLAYRAVVEDDGDVCLVTELADGGDAAARLRAWPDGLPPGEVKEIVRSVASALGHLHSQGWVHRDVKPANILFVQGTPKLGDVGTARALTSTARATSTASLAYAAPEVFSGKFGPAVDVYALGCAVYELLTGALPFDGSMGEMVHKHLTSDIAFPTDMPGTFVEMIRACTVKEPDRRWTIERVLSWVDEGKKAAPAMSPEPETPKSAPEPAIRAKPTTPREPANHTNPASSSIPKAAASSPPPRATPKPEAARPRRGSTPTPLDPALRRHLRHHGEHWGDSNAWQSFMRTAAPTTKQHGLSERDLIRRAGQLLPEVQAAKLSEQETITRVGAWVSALRGPRWSAPDWADFLDQINAHDEASVASIRDALISRLYPPGVGATRVLDLGSGVQHLMVYAPLDKLYRPTTKVFDAFRSQPASSIAGVWFSAQPITVREWSAIMAQAAPHGLKPDASALGQADLAEAVLANVVRRFPVDKFRWPTMFEYDGMKWHREQKAQKTAAQVRQQTNPLLTQQRRRKSFRRRPTTLGGLVAQTVGTAAVNMLKETNEAWLSTTGSSKQARNKKLAMNLVSSVPKRG